MHYEAKDHITIDIDGKFLLGGTGAKYNVARDTILNHFNSVILVKLDHIFNSGMHLYRHMQKKNLNRLQIQSLVVVG